MPGSDDGTMDWLPGDRRVKMFVEKDQGYATVSTAGCAGRGDILAYLNCDEQLPGALTVTGYEQHPQIRRAVR